MAMKWKGAEALVIVKVRAVGCLKDGKTALKEFQLEFEGTRAYLVWDDYNIGRLLFKARVELNPRLLRKPDRQSSKYYYRGKITLPHPEDN